MTEKAAVNFNCPSKVLEEFDETWKHTGRYRDRTDALITAMKFFIEENKKEA